MSAPGGNDSAQERTEAPTPRRLEQAREKGQVARSRELNTMAVMLAGAGGMLAFGPWMMGRLERLLTGGLTPEVGAGFTPADVVAALWSSLLGGVATLVPLLALLVVAALAGPASLGGLVFSAEGAKLDPNRLNPVNGIKRIFSAQGLMELVKTLLKFAVLAGVSVALLWWLADDLLGLGSRSPRAGLAEAAGMLQIAFLVLAGALALIAAVDAPFQIWNHLRRLRMTRQEVKDELKETQGNPEMRAKVRRVQQEMAGRRMMSEVPTADVVLTNPTHYAVALRYTDRPDRAPRVVAKGAELVAARIREVAEAHRVPVCSAPALTRAVYFNAQLGDEIPAGLYLAVARVLAYVFELKTSRRDGAAAPSFPRELPVPDQLAGPPAHGDPA